MQCLCSSWKLLTGHSSAHCGLSNVVVTSHCRVGEQTQPPILMTATRAKLSTQKVEVPDMIALPPPPTSIPLGRTFHYSYFFHSFIVLLKKATLKGHDWGNLEWLSLCVYIYICRWKGDTNQELSNLHRNTPQLDWLRIQSVRFEALASVTKYVDTLYIYTHDVTLYGWSRMN